MTDRTPLEHEVRRSLQARAEAIEVDDRDFDPGIVAMVALDEPGEPWRARRLQRRVLVAVAVVAVLVGAVAVVRQTGKSNGAVHVAAGSTTSVAPSTTAAATSPTTPTNTPPIRQVAQAALVAQTTSVPAKVLDAVGAGTTATFPVDLPGPLLTENGKPRVIWIGAEYCPFCAVERWPLVLALSRFGTFSNLQVTSSAGMTPAGVSEVYPDTQSFSFYGSTYTSDYLAFDSVEQTNRAYQPLENPTTEESDILAKFDAPPYTSNAGAIPFVDFGNASMLSGSTFDPQVLQGKSAEEIASALSDPTSPIAKGVDGSANVITASLCAITGNRPGSVCSDPAIAALNVATRPTGASGPTGAPSGGS